MNMAAIRAGIRMVMTMNDFFLTLVVYSLVRTNPILLMVFG
jgi:hypothetical protein